MWTLCGAAIGVLLELSRPRRVKPPGLRAENLSAPEVRRENGMKRHRDVSDHGLIGDQQTVALLDAESDTSKYVSRFLGTAFLINRFLTEDGPGAIPVPG